MTVYHMLVPIDYKQALESAIALARKLRIHLC